MKACIIYNSKHGTTKAYAAEISDYLRENNVENQVASIHDYDPAFLESCDMVLLGSWTSGLFFFAQHPDPLWKQFVSSLPALSGKRLGLFTTYKVLTGTMFQKMEASLKGKTDGSPVYLKSRNKHLTPGNIESLNRIMAT